MPNGRTNKPRRGGILRVLAIPFIGAAVCGCLFFRFGGPWNIGGLKGAAFGAAGGFIGSLILMVAEWLERTSEDARSRVEQQAKDETAAFGLSHELTESRGSSVAWLACFLACLTAWIPFAGFLVACWAIYWANRANAPKAIGCLLVCLFYFAIAVSLTAIVIIIIEILE